MYRDDISLRYILTIGDRRSAGGRPPAAPPASAFGPAWPPRRWRCRSLVGAADERGGRDRPRPTGTGLRCPCRMVKVRGRGSGPAGRLDRPILDGDLISRAHRVAVAAAGEDRDRHPAPDAGPAARPPTAPPAAPAPRTSLPGPPRGCLAAGSSGSARRAAPPHRGTKPRTVASALADPSPPMVRLVTAARALAAGARATARPMRSRSARSRCPGPGAEGLGQQPLRGRDAGAQLEGNPAEVEGQLDAGQGGKDLELVEGAQMADPEDALTQPAQPRAEGEVEPGLGEAEHVVGIAPWREDHGGQRVGALGGTLTEDLEPPGLHRTSDRPGQSRVPREHRLQPLLEEHAQRLTQPEQMEGGRRVGEI